MLRARLVGDGARLRTRRKRAHGTWPQRLLAIAAPVASLYVYLQIGTEECHIVNLRDLKSNKRETGGKYRLAHASEVK